MENRHDFDYDRVAQFRSKYIDDNLILDFVSPDKNDVVLDIGSGDGHYTMLFSKYAKTAYAMDVNPKSKGMTEEKIRASGTKNVVHMLSDACEGDLPAAFNKVFFGTSFHDLPCRENLLDNLRAHGMTGLRIILLEFKKEDTPGPPVEIRLAEEELQELLKSHGFVLRRSKALQIHYIHEYELRS
ncbi:MAG: methyltransferase domain-containing protein [Candidatus Thermoplasmatota archaeon]|nr:methyltransferase domain-containing protein [Candidatus Thermoplasmatota archaeon]